MCADFPWLCCPRAALARVLALAESKFGFKFRVGYESEFMLLREAAPGSQPPFRPVDTSVYCQSSSFNAIAPGMELRDHAPAPCNCMPASEECGRCQYPWPFPARSVLGDEAHDQMS